MSALMTMTDHNDAEELYFRISDHIQSVGLGIQVLWIKSGLILLPSKPNSLLLNIYLQSVFSEPVSMW